MVVFYICIPLKIIHFYHTLNLILEVPMLHVGSVSRTERGISHRHGCQTKLRNHGCQNKVMNLIDNSEIKYLKGKGFFLFNSRFQHKGLLEIKD